MEKPQPQKVPARARTRPLRPKCLRCWCYEAQSAGHDALRNTDAREVREAESLPRAAALRAGREWQPWREAEVHRAHEGLRSRAAARGLAAHAGHRQRPDSARPGTCLRWCCSRAGRRVMPCAPPMTQAFESSSTTRIVSTGAVRSLAKADLLQRLLLPTPRPAPRPQQALDRMPATSRSPRRWSSLPGRSGGCARHRRGSQSSDFAGGYAGFNPEAGIGLKRWAPLPTQTYRFRLAVSVT